MRWRRRGLTPPAAPRRLAAAAVKPASSVSARPALPGHVQRADRPVGAERADPRLDRARHDGVGGALRALVDLDPAVGGRQAEDPVLLGRPRPRGRRCRALRARRLQHAGREPEDRADVDVLALARPAPGPVVAPARERAEHRHELARALGQLVVHARRHLAVALARQQAVGDHAVQPRAQLLGGDAGQHALQLDEAPRAGGEVTDDQERPLVAHEIEGAGVRRPLVVGVALGRGDGGDCGTSAQYPGGSAGQGENRPLAGVTVPLRTSDSGMGCRPHPDS